MKNIVISVATEEKRRKHIVTEFSKQEIDFEFFDAITPQTSFTIAKALGINLDHTELGAGEISCLLSHVMLWKKALDENLDYIAVFEDDIYIGEHAKDFLSDSQWIPESCNIIKLEAFSRSIKSTIRPVECLQRERKLFPLKSSHVGTAGYILSNKAAASFLRYCQQSKKLISIDKMMFNYYLVDGDLSVYQMLPALCIQEHRMDGTMDIFPSMIKQERTKRREVLSQQHNTKKKTKFEMIYKELSRPFIQLFTFPWIIYSKLSTKKVEFK